MPVAAAPTAVPRGTNGVDVSIPGLYPTRQWAENGEDSDRPETVDMTGEFVGPSSEDP